MKLTKNVNIDKQNKMDDYDITMLKPNKILVKSYLHK